MADFDKYAPNLMKWEARIPAHPEGLSSRELFEYAKLGGWSNHPSDPGGATQVGVTLNTYRTYFGKGKTADDLRNISYGEWTFIMRRYWDRCHGDLIENQSIAEIFVDWHINAGTNAIKKVQEAFGLKADGIVGNLTLGALNGPGHQTVFDRIRTARISYYYKLVSQKPSMKVFLNGWLKRTYSFEYSE